MENESKKLTKQEKLLIKQKKLMEKSPYVNYVKNFQESGHVIQPSLDREDFSDDFDHDEFEHVRFIKTLAYREFQEIIRELKQENPLAELPSEEEFWTDLYNNTTGNAHYHYRTYLSHLRGFTNTNEDCLFGQEYNSNGEIALANHHPFEDLLPESAFRSAPQHAKYLCEMMDILPKSIAHKGSDGQDYPVPSSHREFLKNIDKNLQEFQNMEDEEMRMDELLQVNSDEEEVKKPPVLNSTIKTTVNQSAHLQNRSQPRSPMHYLIEAAKMVEKGTNLIDPNEITFCPKLAIDNDRTVTEVFSDEEDVQMQDVTIQPKEQQSIASKFVNRGNGGNNNGQGGAGIC